MTRINVVPVEELNDNHLLAEYFELPRIFILVQNHWVLGRLPENLKIPGTYVLGSGHMRFFYNKLTYLHNRHSELYKEGTKRKLSLQIDLNVGRYLLPPLYESEWWNDYHPTAEAIQLNRDRLQYRKKYEGGSYIKE